MDLNRNDSPNNNNNNNDGRKPGGNRPKGSIGTALLITLAIVLLVNWIYGSISKSQYTQTSFSDFLAAKDAGQLSEVEIQSDRIIYMTKEEAGKPAAMQKACYTGLPGGGDLIALSEELDAMGVKVDKKIVEDNSLIMMILSYALMIGGLFLVMNLLTKRMGGDGMMALTVVQGAEIFAACLPIAFVGLISGISQGKAAAAGVMLVGKRPSELAKGMLFAAMVETYAVLALLVSFLMLNSIQL